MAEIVVKKDVNNNFPIFIIKKKNLKKIIERDKPI